MYTPEQLAQLRSVDIATVDTSTLVDMHSMERDETAPYEERARRYFEQVKNPYAFRVGDVAVKLEFAQGARTLRDAITAYLTAIKRNA